MTKNRQLANQINVVTEEKLEVEKICFEDQCEQRTLADALQKTQNKIARLAKQLIENIEDQQEMIREERRLKDEFRKMEIKT